MNDAELDQFEALIDIPDQELLSWAIGAQPVPGLRNCPLLIELLQYRP
jgi:antitoxin CptB